MCSSDSGDEGDVTIVVEWPVYDRVTQSVVETLTTADGFTRMGNAAFLDSLEAQKHLGPGS